MRQIFISYRRSDSLETTGRVFDYLRQRIGADKVFRDIDNIGPGEVFADVIDRRLKNCDAVLVIIGPAWSNAAHPGTGERRLDDPADLVRVEVTTALRVAQKRRMRVIPVLVGNAAMPTTQELPGEMHGLLDRNAVQVRPDPDFHNDMERLLKGLGVGPARSSVRPRALLAVGATLSAAVIVGIFTYQYLAGQPAPAPTLPAATPPPVVAEPSPDVVQKGAANVEQAPLTLLPPAPEKGDTSIAIVATPTFDASGLFEALQQGNLAENFASGSGGITSVQQYHNVSAGFELGMNIVVNYRLNNADGASCLAGAYFFDSSGLPLRDLDFYYSDGAGNVFVGQPVVPYGGIRDWTTNLTIPYSQLHLPPGIYALAFQAALMCDDPPVMASSQPQTFNVTMQ